MVVIRFDSWCRNRHAVTSAAKQRAPILDSVSDVYFNMVVIFKIRVHQKARPIDSGFDSRHVFIV